MKLHLEEINLADTETYTALMWHPFWLDALLIKAYQFFEDLEPELFKECIQIFSETGAVLCEGQQMDVNFETMEDVTYDELHRNDYQQNWSLKLHHFKIGALMADANEEEAEYLYNRETYWYSLPNYG